MRIRSFNALVLLAILFMASLLMVVLPVQGRYAEPRCPNLQPSIQIIDESGIRFPSRSVTKLEDSFYRDYVIALSRYISAKVCETPPSQRAAYIPPKIELTFVYRPLVTSAQAKNSKSFNLEFPKSNRARFLDSPWVKISINHSPELVVRAMFILSERQFLVDRALTSGARFSTVQPLAPINEDMFKQYMQDYKISVEGAPSPDAWSIALINIVKRLPIEVLWLFRNCDSGPIGRNFMISFTIRVNQELRTFLIGQAAYGYIKPTQVLIDKFFTSAEPEIRHESVLDLEGVFTLDPYPYKLD
jgi:hypothetical protein